MNRKKQIEEFLEDMNTKYQVDDRFKEKIRPMAFNLNHPNVSEEQFYQLLRRIEESYQRHIKSKNNLKNSLEGVTKIAENVNKMSLGLQEIQEGTKEINAKLEKINKFPKKLVDTLIKREHALKEQDMAYNELLKNPKGSC